MCEPRAASLGTFFAARLATYWGRIQNLATMDQNASPISRVAPARRRYLRAALGLFLLGATLGSALDAIHTHFGGTAYTRPILWKMAWWTPLLFGSAFVIGLLRPLWERAHRAPRARAAPPTWTAAAMAMGLFVAAYFASVLPLAWPVVSALLLLLFLVGYWLFDRSAVGLLIAVASAVGGPLVEHVLVRCGTFVHLSPVYLGLSGWLPFLYLCAAVGLTTLARRLVGDG
jgi:hypothetical protein